MNKIFKWLGVLLLIFFGMVIILKNQTKPKNPTQESKVIKIGAILPLTGDAAVYGEPERNILEIAKDEINNSGGVKGEKIEIIYEDGKCNGKDAASAMQKLASVDKVQIVIGGFCSGESLAAEPIATSNKIALFSPSSSSPKLTGISPFFFRNFPSDSSQGTVLAETALKKGWKKIAIILEQKDYALGIYNAFSSKIISLGGETVKEGFPSGTTDYKTILTKLKNSNPDALFLVVQDPSDSIILRQLRELNWKPSLLISDVTIGNVKLIAENSDLLEETIGAEFSTDEKNSKFNNLLEKYKAKYGVDMPFQSYGQT